MFWIAQWTLTLALAASAAPSLVPQGDVVKTWEVDDRQVPIHKEARITIAGVTDGATLNLTGWGLREKRILFFDVDVYVASSFANKPGAQWKDSTLRAIELLMLRDLSGEKVRSSFADTLKENDVDLTEAPVKKLLDQMKFDVAEGTRITILGYKKKDGTQGVIYQMPGRSQQVEGPRIADQFWSIWFGKPADGGLERLKKALMGS